MRKITMTGKRYTRLRVQEELGRYVICLCDCGTLKQFLRGNVLAGYTTSCGCYQAQRVKETVATHGMSRTVLYERWKTIRRRCYNPEVASYSWYGGKGIKICERWQDFANFYADMAPGYSEGLTIDRLDNSKDYSPENCRWVTPSENSRNKHD